MLKRVFSALVLTFCLVVPASAKDLSAADLRKLFPGSYYVTIFNSFTLRVSMRANGVITGTAKGRRDTGKWTIEGRQLCVAWNTWTKGRKGCSALRMENGVIKGRGFSFRA
jgi:hypothetical protein